MEIAVAFLHACDRGEGWDGCKTLCAHDGTTFTVQAMDALPGPPVTANKTLQEYTEWMKGVVEMMKEKATYDVHAAGFDDKASMAIFFFTFAGTSHNVYAIRVKNKKVVSMVKIWNDVFAAQQT